MAIIMAVQFTIGPIQMTLVLSRPNIVRICVQENQMAIKTLSGLTLLTASKYAHAASPLVTSLMAIPLLVGVIVLGMPQTPPVGGQNHANPTLELVQLMARVVITDLIVTETITFV